MKWEKLQEVAHVGAGSGIRDSGFTGIGICLVGAENGV